MSTKAIGFCDLDPAVFGKLATGEVTLKGIPNPGSGNTSVVTSSGSGNAIASHNDGAGVITSIEETITSLSINANILTYTKEDGTTDTIDLSLYLDDTNLARLVSGTLDGGTGIATFTRDDASTFTIDFSALLGGAGSVCDLDDVADPSTLTLEDAFVVICGTGTAADGKKVSLSELGIMETPQAPVLAAGTSNATNETVTSVDLDSTDTYTDGSSPITDTGWTVYDSGTDENDVSAVSQSDGDIDGSDFTDPHTFTGLVMGTSYCAKSYATNSIGTTYGTEVCFDTLTPPPTGFAFDSRIPTFVQSNLVEKDGFVYGWGANQIQKLDVTAFTAWASMSAAAASAGIMSIARNDTHLFVATSSVVGGNHTLNRIDFATETLESIVQTGLDNDGGAGVSHDGFYYYLSGTHIIRVDESDFTATGVSTIPQIVPSFSSQVHGGVVVGTKVYLTSATEVYEIDIPTFTLTGTMTIPSGGRGLYYYGGKFYTGGFNAIHEFTFGGTINSMAIASGWRNFVEGDKLYSTNRTNGEIDVIDLDTFTVSETVNSPSAVEMGIAISGSCVVVASIAATAGTLKFL